MCTRWRETVRENYFTRWSKDIAVHQFPPRFLQFLRSLFVGGDAVVAHEVFAQGADQDQGHQGGQKDRDQNGIGNGQPMNVVVRLTVHRQINVPPRRLRNNKEQENTRQQQLKHKSANEPPPTTHHPPLTQDVGELIHSIP